MASRPDATAIAQLGAEVLRPYWLAWLDIDGDPVRATTWPVSITPSATGDADLDGFTFQALDPALVSITLPNEQASGTDTVLASLSGLLLPNADLFAAIGDRANWQGRDARLWMAVCDADGVQQGPIWQLYTGKMSSLTIRTSSTGGTIDVEIESYLATLAPASNRTYLDQALFDPADQSAAASIACANGVSNGGLGLSGQIGGGGGRGASAGELAARVFLMRRELAPARSPDWEARLNALIAARWREPFRWGANDCALFGADVVAALTGADFGEAFRGGYDDAEGAARALRAHGAGTVVRTFDRHLRRTLPAFARRGDLVRVPRGEAAPLGAIGVAMGSDALCVGDEGLVRVSRSLWTLA